VIFALREDIEDSVNCPNELTLTGECTVRTWIWLRTNPRSQTTS